MIGKRNVPQILAFLASNSFDSPDHVALGLSLAYKPLLALLSKWSLFETESIAFGSTLLLKFELSAALGEPKPTSYGCCPATNVLAPLTDS